MKAPNFPAGLSGLASHYDTILCDVWGVIHNGRAAFTEACDALVKFRAQGGQVSLITNAPVPEAQVVRYFEPLGVPRAAFDLCVSSGDATRAELAAHPDRSVWRMGGDEGWEHDRFLFDGLGLTFIDNDSADLLLCIGLRDQVNDQPEDYREELGRAVAKGLPMLCANPDKQVRVGGRLYWCAGALAAIYEDLGGQVIYPGKPYAPIYQLAIARLTGLKAKPQRILCIGDSPATDVRGARLQGFDSLYVGTGLKQHGSDFEAEVTDLLADYGEQATYAMTGLRW
jgi:HAD superfamily hydrolase (TIGR01459 family)